MTASHPAGEDESGNPNKICGNLLKELVQPHLLKKIPL
jgi:hypothetical protein